VAHSTTVVSTASGVLLERDLLVPEEDRGVPRPLGVLLQDGLEHDLRGHAPRAGGRAHDALDVVGGVVRAQDAELVPAQARVEGDAPRKERRCVHVVGNAQLPEQLHGPHVEVGRLRMRRGVGMLLDQDALDVLRVEMECRREADGTAADDEDLGAET